MGFCLSWEGPQQGKLLLVELWIRQGILAVLVILIAAATEPAPFVFTLAKPHSLDRGKDKYMVAHKLYICLKLPQEKEGRMGDRNHSSFHPHLGLMRREGFPG